MVAGSAGTPKPIVEKLHAALKTIMAMPDVKQVVDRTGVVPVVSPSLAELDAFIVSEKTRWAKVVQQAGLAGTQ
jgi:tripartite-type tricarboxylate transporter receptor subunit TctC